MMGEIVSYFGTMVPAVTRVSGLDHEAGLIAAGESVVSAGGVDPDFRIALVITALILVTIVVGWIGRRPPDDREG
jgi:hypothetical protein